MRSSDRSTWQEEDDQTPPPPLPAQQGNPSMNGRVFYSAPPINRYKQTKNSALHRKIQIMQYNTKRAMELGWIHLSITAEERVTGFPPHAKPNSRLRIPVPNFYIQDGGVL